MIISFGLVYLFSRVDSRISYNDSMSDHFCISSTLSICILPKSLSCMLLSPMSLKYRKSVVSIGGVCNSAS
jgi:hypothetical protein